MRGRQHWPKKQYNNGALIYQTATKSVVLRHYSVTNDLAIVGVSTMTVLNLGELGLHLETRNRTVPAVCDLGHRRQELVIH